MEHRFKDKSPRAQSRSDDGFDLDNLLHPAGAFAHPSKVVDDPDLTLNEKRAILAAWASDACAIEAAPSLRCLPGGQRPVSFDDIMVALRALDKQAQDRGDDSGRYRRIIRRQRRGFISGSRRGDDGQGRPLN
jgi:hypothetical protein